ncbi:nucleotidyltransferase domain-containing protein [Paenibacillus sp. UNC451MF]|uniref:nucleotidyltransferase domain-containing protein n=1 Tax=Paenibacillus sp. UNC451MF TaxID=1449063 RepID=UPI000568C54D|nr:hypothetical protein [Paenibacillus sp. UNC451MF]
MVYIDKLGDALRTLQAQLHDVEQPWLVGGSCGLLMQGVSIAEAPKDLDIYADPEGARIIHARLSEYSIDEQVEDRSSIYYSLLSHYNLDGIQVELVGGFQVTMRNSVYIVNAALLNDRFAMKYSLNSGGQLAPIKLMPLEHELIFNLLRNRPDRYEAIAKVISIRNIGTNQALEELIQQNSIDEAVIVQLRKLLQR